MIITRIIIINYNNHDNDDNNNNTYNNTNSSTKNSSNNNNSSAASGRAPATTATTQSPVASPIATVQPTVTGYMACNGLESLCDVRVNELLFATLHNAVSTQQDGVTLLADHYYPRGSVKPPTVLVRSPCFVLRSSG